MTIVLFCVRGQPPTYLNGQRTTGDGYGNQTCAERGECCERLGDWRGDGKRPGELRRIGADRHTCDARLCGAEVLHPHQQSAGCVEGSKQTSAILQLQCDYTYSVIFRHHPPRQPVLDQDGVFGAKTKAAVKLFQECYPGNLTVDGVVGKQTWAALERAGNSDASITGWKC